MDLHARARRPLDQRARRPHGPGQSNWVARIGGHYGPRPGADTDIDVGRRMEHADAHRLFGEVEQTVSRFDLTNFTRHAVPCEAR